MNLLQSLRRYGQSVWLDGFERGWINRGELQQYIEKDGLRGVRSNFQSLQAAIEGREYDRDFATLAQQGTSRTAQSTYDYLIVRDLQLAADLLKQVHSQAQGHDGFVQVDLPPEALLQPETAIATAQDIWQSVGWSNLLLGIPATQIMLPVIEQLISDHINVNATLVFSPRVYEQVFDRYLRGIESQIQQGESVSDVVCFTSLSIGCLDAMIDPLIASSGISFSVVQARLLYQHYQNLHQSGRWQSLSGEIKPLRLVWDCTDISPESVWRYLQTLAVPETVMMLSLTTLEMYREVSLLPTSLAGGEQDEQIPMSGLQMETVLAERVNSFVNEERERSSNAFRQLLDAIEQKKMR